MASVDVPVALLGYGTVGAAVNRLLIESADEIERATGHRLRVTRALVRDTDKERSWPVPDGVLTTDVEDILGDPSIKVIAEVMGGVEPTGGYVLDCLRRGKNVVSMIPTRAEPIPAAYASASSRAWPLASCCTAISAGMP